MYKKVMVLNLTVLDDNSSMFERLCFCQDCNFSDSFLRLHFIQYFKYLVGHFVAVLASIFLNTLG